MKVLKVPIENVLKDEPKMTMLPLFGPEVNKAINMGCAMFPPGARAPAEGHASHDEDEFSYIISGSLKCNVDGELREVKAGDVSYIPAGEQHSSWNESDELCTLVYMLVKRD